MKRNPSSAHTKRASKQKGGKAAPVLKGWTHRKTWDGCDGYGWMIYINGERFAWAGDERSAKAICDKANTQENAFTQGYVCAVAALVSGHGGGTIARDVLGCNTPDDWNIIDEYDRDILAKVGLAPRRRKSRKATSVGRGGEKV